MRIDGLARSSDFNEWLALSRMAVQKLLGAGERVLGWRQRTNTYPPLKKSRSTRVREDSQTNKAREGFCDWPVHHHI